MICVEYVLYLSSLLNSLHSDVLSSADCFQNQLFLKIISRIPSECQTVLILISPDVLSILIWAQTVCKDYQQMKIIGLNARTKGGRALRGYFGPPLRPKYENCFSQVSSYKFIRTIAQV